MAHKTPSLAKLKTSISQGKNLEDILHNIHYFKFPNSPYFHVRIYDFEGKRISVSTGSRDIDVAREKLPSILRNIYFKITLSDLIQERENNISYIRKSEGTIKCEVQALSHFMSLVGDLDIKKITQSMALRFMEEHVNKAGVIEPWKSKASPAKHHRHLKCIWNELISAKELGEKDNIWEFRSPVVVKLPEYIPEKDELISIIEGLSQIIEIKDVIVSPEILSKLILINSRTGLREEELRNIRIKWIDREAKLLRVWNEVDFKIKDYFKREIPLDSYTFELIEKQMLKAELLLGRPLNREDFLFPRKDGTSLKYENVRGALYKYVRLAHKEFTMGCLRAYYAKNTWRRSTDKLKALCDLKRILGHSTILVTLDYIGESAIEGNQEQLALLEMEAKQWLKLRK